MVQKVAKRIRSRGTGTSDSERMVIESDLIKDESRELFRNPVRGTLPANCRDTPVKHRSHHRNPRWRRHRAFTGGQSSSTCVALVLQHTQTSNIDFSVVSKA